LPKFQVYKDSSGKCRFRLKADNNKIVAVGEAYRNHASCINGINSIKKNSKAVIEDTTVEGPKLSNPKYEVYQDSTGKFRFRLRAGNGQIVAKSQSYQEKDACLNGVEVIRTSCDAEIEDETATGKFDADNVSVSKIEEVPKASETPITVIEASSNKRDAIIDELRKIRVSVEVGPPPTPPKGMWNEFKEFLSKYKIMGMAIAFVLGLYLGVLVQALVKDFLMPLLGLVMPGMSNLTTYSLTIINQVFSIGDFLVALITFVIVALIVFLVVKVAKRWNID
jgi:large conductance mechanosensitive channel protein